MTKRGGMRLISDNTFFLDQPKKHHDVMQLSSKRKPNINAGSIWPALQNHNLVA